MIRSDRSPRLRRRYLAQVGSVVLMLAVLGSASLAEAAKKPAKASLTLSVPKSVKAGGNFTIRAKGKAGSYDSVAVFAYKGVSCPKTESVAENNLGLTPNTKKVSKNKAFSLSVILTAANPGTHHACAYLYHRALPGGTQLRNAVNYEVTA